MARTPARINAAKRSLAGAIGAGILVPGGGKRNRYMLASNRFGLPTDYAINDSGYASSDTSGRSGGNGTSFAKYQYRSWAFSTTFEARKGSFLWANVVNTIFGVRPNNFPVTIQRVDVRRWSDGAVVAQVKWGGSTSKILAPAERVWNDPMATLPANGLYFLDVYWVAAEHGAYPALPPMYQAGENGAESLTNDFSVTGRPTGSGTASAIGGSFGPVMFAAEGWEGQVCPILFADSITDQTTVSAKLAAGRGDAGYLQQALGDVASGPMNWMTTARYSSNFFATMRDGVSSDANPTDAKGVIDWIADACALLQPEPMFDVAISAHGRNNLATNQTFAGMQTLVEEFAAKLQSRYPGMPLVQLATPPSVTVPANSFITPGVTQTPSGAGNSAGGTIERWRNWIVGNGGGKIENTTRDAPIFIGIDPWSDSRDPSDFGKWVVDSWQATLLEAVAANSTNVIHLSDKPDVGDTLAFESGTSNFETGARIFTVASVVARQGGGWTVTGVGGARNSQADATAPNVNGRLAKAHDVGAVVNRVASADIPGAAIVHPAHKYQQLAKTRIVPFKDAIAVAARTFLPAGSFGLGPASASFAANSTAGLPISAIDGLNTGETIATIAPNDGRLTLDASRRTLLVGLTASAVGTIAARLTTTSGRKLSMSIAVAASAPITLGNLFQTAQANSYSVYADEAENTPLFRVARRAIGSTLTLTVSGNKLKLVDDGTDAFVVKGPGSLTLGESIPITVTETHPNATNSGLQSSSQVGVNAKGNWPAVLAAGYKNVAMAGQVNNASRGAFGTRTRTYARKPMKLGRRSQKSLYVGFSTVRIEALTSSEELAGPGTPIAAASVEIPGAPTPVVRLLFGGSQTFTIPGGCDLYFADELTPSMFGLTEFEDSTEVITNTIVDIPDGAVVYTCGQTLGTSYIYDPTVDTRAPADLVMIQGGIGQPSGGATLPGPAPVMIAGLPVDGKTQVPSLFVATDSIGDRLSDGGGVGDNGGGYAKRAAFAAGIPFFSHSLGGRQIGHWNANNYYSRVYARFCSMAYCSLGTNDVGGGQTDTRIWSSLQKFYAQMRSLGHTRVTQGTLPPRVSTGTRNGSMENILTNYRCTDLANQFPWYTSGVGGIGYELGGYKDQVNTRIRNGIGASGGPDALLDLAALCSDADSGPSKYKLRSFTSSLTSASAVGATTLVMADKPDVDETFVIEPGTANVEPVPTQNFPFKVVSVTGSGPYTVTITGGTLTLAHPVGSVIRATNCNDETHPTTPIHKEAAAILRDQLLATYPAYSFTNSEASAYVARMTSPPSDKRRALVDKLFGDLKTAGVLSVLDELHIVAAHTQQAANENLVSSAYTLTSTAFPTWTKDRGYKGNGSNQFASTNFNPSTATGAKHQQDSAHIGVFTLMDGTTGEDYGSANGRTNVHSRASGHGGRVSQTTGGLGGSGSTASPHHVVANRTGASASELLVDGAQAATLTTASTSLATGLDLLRNNSSYGDAQVAVIHTGGALTSTAQKTGLYNALKSYLQGVGAIAA
ncbi:hypothetical protein [Aureimonas sp. N4]|uniref:hypothetical protein n=1 Tax=Aureimonas sp. N4 TaxID=1638165 RepID=UPI000780FEAF|nr:hypothetical protein [Aureimonas sp. N4]